MPRGGGERTVLLSQKEAAKKGSDVFCRQNLHTLTFIAGRRESQERRKTFKKDQLGKTIFFDFVPHCSFADFKQAGGFGFIA